MPRCPECRLEWPADVVRCPADGSSLVGAAEIEFAKTVTPSHSSPSLGGRQHSPELPPATQVGDYRIERKLGAGGMGCVYAATHSLLGKQAAIKVLDAEPGTGARTTERILDEARAVNALGHPNIVEIFAFGALEDGRPYMVMDHLHGETLAARLKKGCLSPEEAAHVVEQVCRGLQAVHDRGVIHRDLKPENVFLVDVGTRFPLVKLLDFGIAKLARGSKGQRDTHSGSMVGTPLYVSPEAARGLGVDARTDVYSLGVMLFEIVLDRPPFQGRTAVDTISMHLHDPPPRPSDLWAGIPPALERLLLRMLDKDPEGRPSLAEVRAVMARLEKTREEPAEVRAHPALVAAPPPATPPPAALEAAPPAGPGASGVRRVTGPVPSPDAASVSATGETAPLAVVGLDAREGRGPWPLVVGITLVAVAAVVFLAWPRPAHQPEAKAPPAAVTAAAVAAAAPASGPALSPPGAREPRAGRATLVIRPSAPDARVEIDGRVVAVTGGVALAPDVTPGAHEIAVTAEGHVPLRTRVQVGAGARVEVPVILVREPPSRKAPRREPRDVKAPVPVAPVKAPPAKPAAPAPADDMPIDPFKKSR